MNDLVLKQKIRLGSFTYSDYTSFQEHQATSNKMDKNKKHHFLKCFMPFQNGMHEKTQFAIPMNHTMSEGIKA